MTTLQELETLSVPEKLQLVEDLWDSIARSRTAIPIPGWQKEELARRKDKYEIIIYWSEDDQAFIAEAPELPGCLAHGNTHEEALSNIHSAIDLWIETAKEFNDPIPKPKGHRLVFA